MKVPEDAFEMNYVFTDGEGATDNNMGQNYLTLLDSNMTAELWAERAMERQVCSGCLSYTCELIVCRNFYPEMHVLLWTVLPFGQDIRGNRHVN